MKTIVITASSSYGINSVSDIDNKELTRERYLEIEACYISLLEFLFDLLKEKSLFLVRFSDDRGISEDLTDQTVFSLDNPKEKYCAGEYLDISSVLLLTRFCLRDLMWAKLKGQSGIYVFFSHDMSLCIELPSDLEVVFEGVERYLFEHNFSFEYCDDN